jgi:hypothetical protein
MAYTLSKSDYKIARTCLTRLYYKKQGYPTVDDGRVQEVTMAMVIIWRYWWERKQLNK